MKTYNTNGRTLVILPVVGLVAGILLTYLSTVGALSSRVDVNTTHIGTISGRIDRIEARRTEDRKEILERLERIEDKLDKLR